MKDEERINKDYDHQIESGKSQNRKPLERVLSTINQFSFMFIVR